MRKSSLDFIMSKLALLADDAHLGARKAFIARHATNHANDRVDARLGFVELHPRAKSPVAPFEITVAAIRVRRAVGRARSQSHKVVRQRNRTRHAQPKN